MAGIRSFIALPISEEARARLGAIRHAAPHGAPVRWIAPESIHLTLKFLGNVEVDRVEALKGALGELAWDAGALHLTFSEIGAFPNLKRPRVLWVGIGAGADLVCDLAARVERITAGLGFPREERRFTPHLTLGRVTGHGPASWAEHLVRSARFTPMQVAVDSLVLYRSELLPGGARHTPLLVVPLATQ
jgi:2'-5' RNA ligase